MEPEKHPTARARLTAAPVSGGVEVVVPSDQPARPGARVSVNGTFQATVDLNPGVTKVPFSQLVDETGKPMPEDTRVHGITVRYSTTAHEHMAHSFQFRAAD